MSYETLAVKEGLGRVVMCQGCSDVHLAVDSITVRIAPEAFVALAEMVQEALRHPKLCKSQDDPKMFMGSHLFSRA